MEGWKFTDMFGGMEDTMNNRVVILYDGNVLHNQSRDQLDIVGTL